MQKPDKNRIHNIYIRRADANDARAIADVLHRAFVAYRASYTTEAFKATTPTTEQIRSRMNEGPAWVACAGDTIAGTVSAVPKDTGVYIRSMAVLPEVSGQGIGTLLLKEVELYAFSLGYSRLYLSTTPFLYAAIRLYERNGFQRDDAGPHDLYGTPLFTMAKSLNSPADENESATINK